MSEFDESPRRRRRRKRRRQKDLFNIPGVRKIILTELTQKIIECEVGEQVSSESPWKYVKKELVQDNLELHEESSEFLPIRREILAYPRDQLLIGYIADETQDREDEFYVCVTEEATDTVQKIIEKLRLDQEYRLHYQLYKNIHPWHSMGTEGEVDEAIIKNTRPLLEVEVETQYPIFPGKVQFRLLTAEEKRDGYMELRCLPDENLVNVYMRRIDSSIQVAPQVISTEAQTICTYPKNTATQYLYDIGKIDALLAKCEPKIIRYANENLEDLSDLLKVNGTINLYANDFDSLVKDPQTQIGWSLAKEFVEYMFFMDVNLCKGKMISDIYWHQMWTGTLAIAYSSIAPNIFHNGPSKDDEVSNGDAEVDYMSRVYKAVHDHNVVLIWCFNDGLKPKLILESPREVYRVSFCKFDENILIGGCKNGQIIIWDIRNKLQKVEEKEVLTIAQQKYRSYMHSLMGWMKNIHDISVVRPAAVSELRYSHKSAVTGINWMDPRFEFSRTGNLTEIDQEDEERKDKYSMQFLTSSLDGSVMIWDLKKKPQLTTGSYKPKKLKRLKKRPSALEVDVSPYRVLHLNLKPIYKINVTRGDPKKQPIAITRCSSAFCWLKYEPLIDPEKTKKVDIKERIHYRPIMQTTRTLKELTPSKMRIGTIEGDYAEIQWEGQDFDSGEAVNAEHCKFNFRSKYHDGPINSIHTSKSNMSTLTVGGKIFCLWRKELPNRPVLWRRSRQVFTKGEWSVFQSYKIVLHSLSGITQKWILSMYSKGPFFQQVMSNGFLTSSGIHPFPKEKNLYGIGDEQGAFRLFYLPSAAAVGVDSEEKNMENFVNREIVRKKQFLKWQDDFNKRNEGYLLRMKLEAEQRAKEEAEREAKLKLDEKIPERSVKKGPQPGKYMEWVREQRQLREEARIKAMIINKKQLDTKELEKRRKPLQKLDEENERKKRKQKERLKQGENIFRETVASLFPDVMKDKPIPPPDPYAGGDPTEEKEACYRDYLKALQNAEEYILEHPFHYEFSFKNLLIESRNKDVDIYSHAHLKRYETEKKVRRGSISSETESEEEKEIRRVTDVRKDDAEIAVEEPLEENDEAVVEQRNEDDGT